MRWYYQEQESPWWFDNVMSQDQEQYNNRPDDFIA